MSVLLKRVVARFPDPFQFAIKYLYCASRMMLGRFEETEPEVPLVRRMINNGDLIIDVGANIGTYTSLFSELVGIDGRVIAFEPVPQTFAILAANSLGFKFNNVTLLNAALSDKKSYYGSRILVPESVSGINNYCRAHLSTAAGSSAMGTLITTFPLDVFDIDRKVSLVKIDVEGFELEVLRGMRRLIECHHPYLIVETKDSFVTELMVDMGYRWDRLPNSPNVVFYPNIP